MFALTSLETFVYINLKSDSENCIELRETFEGVKPGYHMNKRNWNSVYLNKDVDDQLLLDLIDEPYCLVVKSLT